MRCVLNESQPSVSSTSSKDAPLSQIEKSVTHLLVATKQLLETLTQWSRGVATDSQVSDVYVRLGYEFNIACRAFTTINVDTSDLGNVPELLRAILEQTLSQEASVESLEKYLPRIRDIIINLLHGLKRKQQKLRQKQSRESGDLPRNSSVTSVSSTSTGLTSMLEQGINNGFRGNSTQLVDQPTSGDHAMPPRGTSTNNKGVPRDISRGSVASSANSTLSSNTMQTLPVLPPQLNDDVSMHNRSGNAPIDTMNFPPPPPEPKQTQNALAALQRGGDLERRASRRYSAYQISKHLGASPNGVPMLPPPQHTPIPNRGRNDARESMKAMQTRTDRQPPRQVSSRLNNELSPVRVPSRISEENAVIDGSASQTDVARNRRGDSKSSRRPTDEGLSATMKGPPSDSLPMELPAEDVVERRPRTPQHKTSASARTHSPRGRRATPTPEDSPRIIKELTLFLQYKTKVKKFMLADGYNDLSLARLQLAFIEKFAWNTHNNGVDLPEIYIQDPVSGVRHELEDLTDIKDRSVLVLNIEPLDEVKRHIDEGLGGLTKIVESVRTAISDQQATIQRVSDQQQDTAKEVARMSTGPARMSLADSPRVNGASAFKPRLQSQAQLTEVQNIRRDLAVVRQTFSTFQSDIQNSMSTIRTKANSVRTVSIKAAVPDVEGDSGRAYVNAGKKNLNEESDKLVTQVDDLQDIVEDLRKDVVTRGVRPLPRQLEEVAKDISQATMELKKMQDFLKRERPIWTKIWERELQQVCTDREEMTMQEDLAADLQDDLEKATQTFALVEQATKEQLKDAPGSGAGRVAVRTLNHVPAADPSAAKEGVLGEVRALQPNHENRVEAIERAEKLRQKELESRRGGEFQKELGNFVDQGKLKKSGGFEEVERKRIAKDERIRREVWERQNGMTAADASFTLPDPGPMSPMTGPGAQPEDDQELEPAQI